MAYATLANLRTYLGLDAGETGDDTLLTACITRATARINRHTGRTFEASTQTRYFLRRNVDRDDRSLLVIDTADLLSITTLKNGDDAATTISASNYWLWPFESASDGSPYWGIKLKEDTAVDGWEFDTDGRVEVAGTWGYSTTAPSDIEQATLRLAAYLYRQRDSQVFETTADPVTGQMIVPPGMPKDVRDILHDYRRIV